MLLTSCVSAAPETDSAKDDLIAAVEKNWTVPLGVADMEKCTVSLRLHLTPEGVVKQIEKLDDDGDPDCRAVAESARRAVLITQNELGRLPITPDKDNPTIIVRWPMKVICEQRGGC